MRMRSVPHPTDLFGVGPLRLALGCNAHPYGSAGRGTSGPGDAASREATVKDCGVAVAKLQGHSWAPTPSKGSRVNVGTTSSVPAIRAGKVCRAVDAGEVGRRTRSRPSTGKPCTWRRGPVCSQHRCAARRSPVNAGASWPGLVEAESRVLTMQTKLHQRGGDRSWLSDFRGVSTCRAGCGQSRTSGSEGGPEKPIVRKATGRSGPTLHAAAGAEALDVLLPLRPARYLQPIRRGVDGRRDRILPVLLPLVQHRAPSCGDRNAHPR